MSKCPYCNRIANPLRFITHSRWSPYKCPQCGKKSEFNGIGVGIVCATGGAIAFTLEKVVDQSRPVTILIMAVIALGLMNILRLKPKESTSDQLQAETTPKTTPSIASDVPDEKS